MTRRDEIIDACVTAILDSWDDWVAVSALASMQTEDPDAYRRAMHTVLRQVVKAAVDAAIRNVKGVST